MVSCSVETIANHLDRHQQLRSDRHPTLSVLTGDIDTATTSFQSWCDKHERSCATVSLSSLFAALQSWLSLICTEGEFVSDVIRYTARQMGVSQESLHHALCEKSIDEFVLFFNHNFQSDSKHREAEICRTFLPRFCESQSVTVNDILESCGVHDESADHQSLLCFAVASTLVPTHRLPALLVTEFKDCVDFSAHLLERLVSSAPSIPVALAIDREQLLQYFQNEHDSRAKALLRETVLDLGESVIVDVDDKLTRIVEVEPQLDQSVQRLILDGASPELVGLFHDAVTSATTSTQSKEDDDQARSAAERFLFERFCSLQETAGLFELNGVLNIPFGNRRTMEVDLLCRDLKIALELDGYYHFQDADAYRRDRRKDLALQNNSFLTIRFLSNDVVVRLEEILDTVLDCITRQQSIFSLAK